MEMESGIDKTLLYIYYEFTICLITNSLDEQGTSRKEVQDVMNQEMDWSFKSSNQNHERIQWKWKEFLSPC